MSAQQGQAAVGDGAFARGDFVQTMFDTGAFGLRVLYGEVIAAGPKAYRIRWESGNTNRVAQGFGDVTLAQDQDAARDAMLAARKEPQ